MKGIRWEMVWNVVVFFGTMIFMTVNFPHAANATCGMTSWYGTESGTRTASGQRFNPEGLTAAHRSLPFNSVLTVTYAGRSIKVRVNDRGPAKWTHRDLDLSKGAARALGMVKTGVVRTCWSDAKDTYNLNRSKAVGDWQRST